MQHCGPSSETSPEPDSIRTYPELMRLTRPFTAVPVVRALDLDSLGVGDRWADLAVATVEH